MPLAVFFLMRVLLYVSFSELYHFFLKKFVFLLDFLKKALFLLYNSIQSIMFKVQVIFNHLNEYNVEFSRYDNALNCYLYYCRLAVFVHSDISSVSILSSTTTIKKFDNYNYFEC